MGRKMTWEEIKKQYPDEWVAVVNYESDEVGNVDGEVAIHLSDKDEFYRELSDVLSQHRNVAVKFTGELIKNAEIPLLWQILGSKENVA